MGFLIGVLFAVLTIILTTTRKYKPDDITDFNKPPNNTAYNNWLSKNKVKKYKVPLDILRYSNNKYLLESEYLQNSVSVLCVILTRNEKNAEAAENTWAKTCTGIELVKLDTQKRKIRMPIKQDRQKSTWSLLCKSLVGIKDKFQWVLIVNDNTFALMENLRLLVAPLNYNESYYLGHPVRFWNTFYNTGLAGYVLSYGSLKKLQGKLNNDSCTAEITYLNQEDFYIG